MGDNFKGKERMCVLRFTKREERLDPIAAFHQTILKLLLTTRRKSSSEPSFQKLCIIVFMLINGVKSVNPAYRHVRNCALCENGNPSGPGSVLPSR